MNIPEKIFLEKCKSLIEEKLSWVESADWKQRDFENLSELIFDKTQVLLSLSTLKRIWKNNTDSIPHPGTLNALAQFLDYKNWLEFKQEIADQLNNVSRENESGNLSSGTGDNLNPDSKDRFFYKPLFVISMIVFVGIVIIIFSVTFTHELNFDNVKFSSKTVVTEGVPNTVIFDYDISQIEFDSAFIQQSWNPKYRARLAKENNKLTSIYYYPGIHRAKLIIDNNIVDQHNLIVKSDNWLAVARYSFEDEIPIYIPSEKIIDSGRMHVPTSTLLEHNVDVSGMKYLISFYNVRDFDNLDGDNFIFETTVKNELEEGGLTCQYLVLTIMCENGRIVLPLAMAGCVANIYVKFIEKWVLGRENDLSAFGCDMEIWNTLKCTNKDRSVEIELNGENVYSLNYEDPAGKIVGICYSFFGSGSVDNINFSRVDGSSVYSDDFSSN